MTYLSHVVDGQGRFTDRAHSLAGSCDYVFSIATPVTGIRK